MCEQKQTPPVKVEVKNLTKKFGDLLVLDNISFDVYQGDLLCVVGPTGCGKTTFLNSLTKIYDITSGQILLDGKPVDPKTNNIAYIFQGDSTMPWLTVEQNVAFGLDIKHVPKARRDELVAKYLDIVGLTKYKSNYPKQLASSMLQRVSIARAFATEPELLFTVPNTCFMPPPKVTSAVVRCVTRREPQVQVKSEEAFWRTVRAGFALRRKTLVNSLQTGRQLPKERLTEIVIACGLSPTVRGEALGLEEYARLADALAEEA